MSALGQSVDDYLSIRRALGYKLVDEGRLLIDFVDFVDQAGAVAVTTELAVSWAMLPQETSVGWWARRLNTVRGFARHHQTIDAGSEIPPVGVLPGRNHRPTPYLYSDDDVTALLAAARTLSPPLRAATFETLLGLLASTGMRIGEAMRLDDPDIDWVDAVLTINNSKFGRSRFVPVHPSTLNALRAYTDLRDRLCLHPNAPSVFVSTRAARLAQSTVNDTFHQLLDQAGLDRTATGNRPRVHDLRHSFAVKTLLGWYGDGGDVQARLPALSAYLGHVHPSDTYWYLSAAPELLGLAADRLPAPEGGRT